MAYEDPRAKQKQAFKTNSGNTYTAGAEGQKKVEEEQSYQDSGYSYDPGVTNPEPTYDEPVSEPTQEVVKPPEPNYDSVETTTDTTTGESWQDEKKTETDNKAEESKPIVYTGGSLGKTSTGTGTTTTANSGTSTTQSISSEQYGTEDWKKKAEADKAANARSGERREAAGYYKTSGGGAYSTGFGGITGGGEPVYPNQPKTTTTTTNTPASSYLGNTGLATTSTGAVSGQVLGDTVTATGSKTPGATYTPKTQLDFKNAQAEAADRNAAVDARENDLRYYGESYLPNRYGEGTEAFGNLLNEGAKAVANSPTEYYDAINHVYVREVPDGKGGSDIYTKGDGGITNSIDKRTGTIKSEAPGWEWQGYYDEGHRSAPDAQAADNRLLMRNGTTGTATTGSTTKGNSIGNTTTGTTTTSGNTTGSTAKTEEELKKEAEANYRSGDAGNQRYDARLARQGSGTAGTTNGTSTGATDTESTKPPSGSTYFTPSYGQDMEKGVKAPYRTEGYTEEELNAYGNKPRSDWKYYNGKVAYEGYYLAPNGKYYPVDQTKYEYWKRNGGSYKGWEEGMRDYWNNFGTFYGYNKRKTNYGGGGGGYRYYGGSGNYYSGSGSSGSSNNSNGLYWNPNTSWSI